MKTKTPTFTIDADSFKAMLEPWHEALRKAKGNLPPNPNLLDLSRAVFRTGLNYQQREAWTDVAHEIKDYMGVDNLCEVNVLVKL